MFEDEGRLSTLDFVCWVMDRPERPLDFSLIIHSRDLPDIDRLIAGASSACRRHPVMACTTDGSRWRRAAGDVKNLVQVANPAANTSALHDFVNQPFDLRADRPVRQLLIPGPDGIDRLATRVHHAAADGAGAAQWLIHQLRVARGAEKPALAQPLDIERPRLRSARPTLRKFVEQPSSPMWRRHATISRDRRWLTVTIDCSELRRLCRDLGRFTYNDLLSTIALDSLAAWNRLHHADASRIGIWLPVDIRSAGTRKSGNGTSRIRVHADFAESASWIEKASSVHGAISRSMANREWAVPPSPPNLRPRWLMAALLRGYLGRRWADVGTATFSHADRWGGEPKDFFERVDRIECVGPLHARHAVSMTGVTHVNRTWLTFTYDPAQLTESDVSEMSAMYRQRTELAFREIAASMHQRMASRLVRRAAMSC